MEYDFKAIEKRWQDYWEKEKLNEVKEDPSRPKYYVLDMFPYPSGAGLHVGHPLGYIASDVIARYKRHQGYNVLHPMGYDSFGLPAEQYAIQTGQHPAVTTAANIDRYRQQLKQLGFNYDWSRELSTSNPDYYKHTQWIFTQLFESWYNLKSNRAESIETLIAALEKNGSYGVEAAMEADWWQALDLSKFHFGPHFAGEFTATDWQVLNDWQKREILQHYRLAYLSDTWVNWCEALGTVLANDEVQDGRSERGGHPVEQRLMKQWSLRITAYADRLLRDLEKLDWSESIKEMQRNWIGRSKGAIVRFELENASAMEVFTTRPDTIFGVSFIVLAPEHSLVPLITTPAQAEEVNAYVATTATRSERERLSDAKRISGAFTGAYALHPFSGKRLPVWISDYVLASYGTGAVMAVPAGDQRDLSFARHFHLPVPQIFRDLSIESVAYSDADAVLTNSDFLNDLSAKEAIDKAIGELEQRQVGRGKTNYRLRDAIFSRQRYWGEPFPVYYKQEQAHLLSARHLPLRLPPVDAYLPTKSGEPPLARAARSDWQVYQGERMEYNTMPGWAGSSWYFIRYCDPHNPDALASPGSIKYWGAVDLYMGGAEHATGHLLYARFWTKFLHDKGLIPYEEPFSKMVNQGMILGRSSLVYRLLISSYHLPGVSTPGALPEAAQFPDIFLSKEYYDYWQANKSFGAYAPVIERKLRTLLHELLDSSHEYNLEEISWELACSAAHVDVSLVENDELDVEAFRQWRPGYERALIIANEAGVYRCGFEIEKMSKRWYNVVTPDELCEKYGADTLRLYEMFLGPVEQSKPWDTQGITGVHNFLRKLYRLFYQDGELQVAEEAPSAEEWRALHQCIKKVSEDLERLSWNTVVSALMIAVNELTSLHCRKRAIAEPLLILLSPYAPHLAEQLWHDLGHTDSVTTRPWPKWEERYLEEDFVHYPVSFNGKTRFKLTLPASMDRDGVAQRVLSDEQSQKYLAGKSPKKVIVVPGRIVNIVL